MNTKKEIVKFLEELAIGVQGKCNDLERKVEHYKSLLLEGSVTKEESQKNMDLLQTFRSSLDYTEGQLYEINYILETIKRDKRKKV